MKNTSQIIKTGVLAIVPYTLALLAIEFWKGQNVSRHFFADVTSGDLPMFAVNTTLSMAALWFAALIFILELVVLEKQGRSYSKHWWFCVSQALIFGYLGADDRFLLHENLGTWMNVSDSIFLLIPAACEGLCLILLWQPMKRPLRQSYPLAATALMFIAMLAIDEIMPANMKMRLALEELFKLWGGFFIFVFALSDFNRALSKN